MSRHQFASHQLPLSTSSRQLVTTTMTKPVFSNRAAALRIPTVQPKTIIKYTTMSSTAAMTAARVPCQQAPLDTQPLIMEKTCGLFNSIESTVTPESRHLNKFSTVDPLLSSTSHFSFINFLSTSSSYYSTCDNHQVDKLDLDMETNMNFEPFLNTLVDLNNIVDTPIPSSSTSSLSFSFNQQSEFIQSTALITNTAAVAAAATAANTPKKTFNQKLQEVCFFFLISTVCLSLWIRMSQLR